MSSKWTVKKPEAQGLKSLPAALAAFLILSQIGWTLGCGSRAYYGGKSDDSSQGQQFFFGDSGSGSGGSDGGTGSSSDSGGGSYTPPPIQVLADGMGWDEEGANYREFTYEVEVTNRLVMVYRPEIPTETFPGTGKVPLVSKMSVQIHIDPCEAEDELDCAWTTPILSNGIEGAQYQTYPKDLSGYFTKQCAPGETPQQCSQTVTITVKKPQTDYQCYDHGWCPNLGYPAYTHAQDGEGWIATLLIETDSTSSL